MKIDTIKTDLPTRSYQSFVELINDPAELELMVKCCDYFYKEYEPRLRPERLDELLKASTPSKVNNFKWFYYRCARGWLVTHQALAATLVLRRRFPREWFVG